MKRLGINYVGLIDSIEDTTGSLDWIRSFKPPPKTTIGTRCESEDGSDVNGQQS